MVLKPYNVECSHCNCNFSVFASINSGFAICPRCEEKFSWKEGFDNCWQIVDGWVELTSQDNKFTEEEPTQNNGGKTDYYQLASAPFSIDDFDDFAEWRGLNGNQFNMGKAMWTFNVGRHDGTNYERDLNKIIHYANREKLRLKREAK